MLHTFKKTSLLEFSVFGRRDWPGNWSGKGIEWAMEQGIGINPLGITLLPLPPSEESGGRGWLVFFTSRYLPRSSL